MLTEQLQELAKARAAVAQIEQSIEANRTSQLAGLPAQFGYASPAEFITAFKKAIGAGGGSKPRKAKSLPKPTDAGEKKRTRAKITDEVKAEVAKLVEAGKTGAEIAEAVGISLPSVQNIKKALGLVKPR